MKKQSDYLGIIIIVLVAISIFLSIVLITKSAIEQNNVVIPRISGVYIPIDGDNLAVIVLNISDSYESQLVKANQQAFLEITKLKQGGNKNE
jgi:hypothetical protein